jgi:nickel superoxide dismutase
MRLLTRLLEPRAVAHAHEATKLAGGAGTKGSADPAVAGQLLAKIEEISKIFWETKQG